MMRKYKWGFLLIILIIFSNTTPANADVFVKGYYRKDGTYVKPHHRSDPDGNFYNNWSTYGNINPYTGEIGTKRYPDYSSSFYYNPFPLWNNVNSYDNTNTTVENNYSSSTPIEQTDDTITTPIEQTEDTTTTPMEQTEDTTTTPLVSDDESINTADTFIFSWDTPDEISAKELLVEYFNDINTRSYMPAYDCWTTNWQKKHPYDSFEEGYTDVINTIDEMNSDTTSNGIVLEGTITANEGWEQTTHQYHYIYTVKNIDGTLKLAKGKLEKLW